MRRAQLSSCLRPAVQLVNMVLSTYQYIMALLPWISSLCARIIVVEMLLPER
jgi:hypothetical protein